MTTSYGISKSKKIVVGFNVIYSSDNFTKCFTFTDGMEGRGDIDLSTTTSSIININTGTGNGTTTIGHLSGGSTSIIGITNITGPFSVNATGSGTTNIGTGTGNTVIGNNTGTTSIDGSIVTINNPSVSGNLEITGELKVIGDTKLSGGTLAVNENMNVTGTSTFEGTTTINATGAAQTNIGTGAGNTVIGNSTGTTSIDGSTVTINNPTVLGNLGVIGELKVVGDTKLSGGTLTVNENMNVSGTSTFEGTTTINASGAAQTDIGTGTGVTVIGNSTGGTTIYKTTLSGETNINGPTNINASSGENVNINTGEAPSTTNIGSDSNSSVTNLLGTVNINTSGSNPTSIGNENSTTTILGTLVLPTGVEFDILTANTINVKTINYKNETKSQIETVKVETNGLSITDNMIELNTRKAVQSGIASYASYLLQPIKGTGAIVTTSTTVKILRDDSNVSLLTALLSSYASSFEITIGSIPITSNIISIDISTGFLIITCASALVLETSNYIISLKTNLLTGITNTSFINNINGTNAILTSSTTLTFNSNDRNFGILLTIPDTTVFQIMLSESGSTAQISYNATMLNSAGVITLTLDNPSSFSMNVATISYSIASPDNSSLLSPSYNVDITGTFTSATEIKFTSTNPALKRIIDNSNCLLTPTGYTARNIKNLIVDDSNNWTITVDAKSGDPSSFPSSSFASTLTINIANMIQSVYNTSIVQSTLDDCVATNMTGNSNLWYSTFISSPNQYCPIISATTTSFTLACAILSLSVDICSFSFGKGMFFNTIINNKTTKLSFNNADELLQNKTMINSLIYGKAMWKIKLGNTLLSFTNIGSEDGINYASFSSYNNTGGNVLYEFVPVEINPTLISINNVMECDGRYNKFSFGTSASGLNSGNSSIISAKSQLEAATFSSYVPASFEEELVVPHFMLTNPTTLNHATANIIMPNSWRMALVGNELAIQYLVPASTNSCYEIWKTVQIWGSE